MVKPFRRHDFDLFTPDRVKDPDYDGPRLELKRKLKGWGEAARARIRQETGLELKVQTSLHRPYRHNRWRVDSQRVLLTATAGQKAGLERLLGKAFKSDVASGVVQMTIGLAISRPGLETALRVHPGAWWDGAAWEKAASAAPDRLVALLRALPPDFALAAGGDPAACAGLTAATLPGVLRRYRPAEHWLTLGRHHPREAMIEGLPDQEELLLEDLAALAPPYGLVKEYAP